METLLTFVGDDRDTVISILALYLPPQGKDSSFEKGRTTGISSGSDSVTFYHDAMQMRCLGVSSEVWNLLFLLRSKV